MARIAIDIDSTLHHYWDLFRSVVRERYGVDLAYENQTDWGNTEIPEEYLRAAVSETHSDENIAAAEPYPGAPETVQAWHERGHWIHITSHRAESCAPATARWLDGVGIPFDDLHCSFDKVTRCVDLGIDVSWTTARSTWKALGRRELSARPSATRGTAVWRAATGSW